MRVSYVTNTTDILQNVKFCEATNSRCVYVCVYVCVCVCVCVCVWSRYRPSGPKVQNITNLTNFFQNLYEIENILHVDGGISQFCHGFEYVQDWDTYMCESIWAFNKCTWLCVMFICACVLFSGMCVRVSSSRGAGPSCRHGRLWRRLGRCRPRHQSGPSGSPHSSSASPVEDFPLPRVSEMQYSETPVVLLEYKWRSLQAREHVASVLRN